MHIFQAIIKDHEEIKDLLNELISLEKEDKEDRKDIIQNIRDELIPHARAEEAILYNSLRALDHGKSMVMHSYQEHMEAEALLRALQVEDKIDMSWKNTAKKLKDALEKHISEEENKLFKIAREVISEQDAETLGKLFMESKPKIREEGFVKNTLEMMVNLLPPKFSGALKNLKAS